MYKNKQTIREKKIAMKRIVLSNSFRIALLFVVAIFGVLYVVNTSAVSTKGYDISDLEKQLVNLERENQRLEFDIAKNRSMQSIQTRLENMDLILAENVEYATIAGTEVALR